MPVLVFPVILFAVSSSHGQDALDKVRALPLQTLDGDSPVYYPEGHRGQATRLQALLQDSARFFESRLGVSERFAIALLDQPDWERIRPIPYGLPYVSGPPDVVVLPLTNEHELGRLVRQSLEHSRLPEETGRTVEALTREFVWLIGFHELGHVYGRALGIEFPEKWTFELMATYLAWAYLAEARPETAALWLDISRNVLAGMDPVHRSLDAFEELYVRVGVSNYAWYQMVILMRVAEVYEETGLSFVQEWKARGLPAGSDDHCVEAFERLHGGFAEWAATHRLTD